MFLSEISDILYLTKRTFFGILFVSRRGEGEKGNKNLFSGAAAMKAGSVFLPTTLLFISVFSFAGVEDDGFISEGEYAYGVRWTSSDPPLIVNGGGADVIEVRDYGRLEVQYTSTPITETTGIWDILVTGNAHLKYLGGMTEEITTHVNGTVELKGGHVDAITSMQYATRTHIDLFPVSRSGTGWLLELRDRLMDDSPRGIA